MTIQETIGGTGLMLLKDSGSGASLNCDVRYVAKITLRVTNEEDYQFSTSAEPMKTTLKPLLDACFPSCCRSAHPNGVEWKRLADAPLPIGEAIRETILPVLASRGVEPESVQFTQFEPDSRAISMFTQIRQAKPEPANEEARRRVEEDLARINRAPGCEPDAPERTKAARQLMQNVAAGVAPQTGSAPAASPRREWLCACGSRNSSRFCPNCGASEPTEWLCACGSRNSSRFCPNCGAEKGK